MEPNKKLNNGYKNEKIDAINSPVICDGRMKQKEVKKKSHENQKEEN